MRIRFLKNMDDRDLEVVRDLLFYENEIGGKNYYSKLSDNGVAWRLKDLPIKIPPPIYKKLLERKIIVKIKEDLYHINPVHKKDIETELKFIKGDMAHGIDFEKALRYTIRSGNDARAILNILKFQKRWDSMYDDLGWSLSRAREIIINSGSDLSLLNRLRDSGLIRELSDGEYQLVKFSEEYLEPYLESMFSTEDAVFEYMEVVRRMKREYENFISTMDEERLDEIKTMIRDVWDIENYTKHINESLYLDLLLPIIQQYGMADVSIYSSEGRKITQTGFSLAYFGEPGTGKTFATDDFIRGNEREGIPAHGIIGRVRYAEGMTPKKFISILEAYQNYPVDWVIPEFNDFFRYRGMVEKFKLVMEHREVSDETKKEVIRPYKVSSFFIVNYNTKFSGTKWDVTIGDPNFEAIEDRMICRVFMNDEMREREIYRNMVRRVSGDIDWYLSGALRMHLTYSYNFYSNNKFRLILKISDFVDFGNKIREMKKKKSVNISNRIIIKGVQIAGSAALVRGAFANESEIYISDRELSLALKFIEEEINTRAGRIK